jgi:hypothetical protein
MKKKRLKLDRESIRILDPNDLHRVGGGWIRPPITWSCPQPSQVGCSH